MLPIEQTRRALTLEIGKVKIETEAGKAGLRVTFAVDRDTEPTPNAADIAVFNLAPDTRAKLSGSELPCRLSVGYGKESKQVYFGVVRKISHTYAGVDVVTSIATGDGEESSKVATINRSFVKGTPVAKVLDALIAATNFGRGNVGEIAGVALPFGQTLVRPWSYAGPTVDALDAFCRSLGVRWSVQAGDFQFLRTETPYTATMGPLVAPQTGLIGSPRQDTEKDGTVITLGTALLLPDLVPGVRFKLKSQQVNGVFVPRKTRHYGDTVGQQWFVDFEAIIA